MDLHDAGASAGYRVPTELPCLLLQRAEAKKCRPRASRYGGSVVLKVGETRPKCGHCKNPMPVLLQVRGRLASAPGVARRELTAMLQLRMSDMPEAVQPHFVLPDVPVDKQLLQVQANRTLHTTHPS